MDILIGSAIEFDTLSLFGSMGQLPYDVSVLNKSDGSSSQYFEKLWVECLLATVVPPTVFS